MMQDNEPRDAIQDLLDNLGYPSDGAWPSDKCEIDCRVNIGVLRRARDAHRLTADQQQVTTDREAGLREAERECQAVWRCAVGDVTSALDVLKNRWVGSKRKAERDAGAVLAGVLDLVWAYRDPAAGNYAQANANGKKLTERVRAALTGSAAK